MLQNSNDSAMDKNQQSQNSESGAQTSSSGGMLGGVTDKLSSVVGSQGSGDNQSYLSKGKPPYVES